MKLGNTIAAAVTGLLLAASTPALGDVKIAVVDLKKLFDNYYRRDQAEKQLKERAAEFDKTRGILMEEYKKANEDLKKLVESANDQAVSASERERRKGEAEKKSQDIRDQENSIRQFDNTSRQTLGEQMNRLRENVLKDIRAIIDEKSKVAGYQLVLDTAAQTVNQTPAILYTSLSGTDLDITDAVLKELNANAPKDAGDSKDTKDAKPADKK
jgi:outer membrane protein